jgi:16S rRNA processing protein RimM
MDEYLQIGEIVNTHGVNGEIKIIPLTDNPERFEDLKWAYIDKKGSIEKYYINGIKYLKNLVVLKLKGVDDLSAAQALKGFFMLVDRENAVKLPENSFFICDILGSTVHDDKGNLLGELVDVLQTGSNDVYIIKDENKRELLLPALKSVVKEVSVENKTMIVTIPKGLFDDEI